MSHLVRWKVNWVRVRDKPLTEKTRFQFPFRLNGIWSWWQLNQIFWTKWNSFWFKIERKIVTKIISQSIWKEILFPQCERLASLGIMGSQLRPPWNWADHHPCDLNWAPIMTREASLSMADVIFPVWLWPSMLTGIILIVDLRCSNFLAKWVPNLEPS